MADIILGRLAEDPSIGMVIPDDPGAGGWDQNKSYAEPLAKRMGIDVLPEHFLFPIGSMFWGRVDALRPLFDLKLDWNDYPQEPIHHDGTVLHAIERLFGVVASRGKYKVATTNVPGVTR
jgi:lipopolysaccharide biosynthesis protein